VIIIVLPIDPRTLLESRREQPYESYQDVPEYDTLIVGQKLYLQVVRHTVHTDVDRRLYVGIPLALQDRMRLHTFDRIFLDRKFNRGD
jgi:hypothetical protein